MARKKRGKHVASRQAQLSKRKRKGKGPSGIPTMSAAQRRRQPVAAAQPSSTGDAATSAAPAMGTAAASPAPQAAAVTMSARQPLVYSYVGKELRRILVLGGVIMVVIVALSFYIN